MIEAIGYQEMLGEEIFIKINCVVQEKPAVLLETMKPEIAERVAADLIAAVEKYNEQHGTSPDRQIITNPGSVRPG